MMDTGKIYIHSLSAIPKENANLLKEGSSVLVRVLKQTGSNSYIASFAGGRFTVNSKDALKPGTTFMARLSFQNGKVNLVKIPQAQNFNSEPKAVITSSNTLTSEIASLLQSLGVAPDSISKTLLQTFYATGSRVNVEKLNKARVAAMKFEGHEEEAAEAALILLEKGIEPTFENISDVLTGFSLEKKFEETERQSDDCFDEKEIEKELRRFFKDLMESDRAGNLSDAGEESDAGNSSDARSASDAGILSDARTDAGFLTVFNHLASRQTEDGAGHFVVVPFEFGFEKGEKQLKGDGVFRVILGISEKILKKTVITFKINGQIWNFVISLDKEHIKKVKLCHFSELSIETDENLCKRLSDFLGGVLVEAESFEKLCGFASGDVPISVVEGLA